jgi:hypothetical protein
MGFFSFLCNGCNLNLAFNGFSGEQVILKHIRHGNVLGEVKGEYNGYGGVFGDYEFCTKKLDSQNSNQNIEASRYILDDSGMKSGISAHHRKCYEELPHYLQNQNVISKNDPEQGWCKKGVRKEFT